MDQSRPNTQFHLLPLAEAAQKLGVPVTTLLAWNESNILKPTITTSGEVGYRMEQIDQFLAIQKAHPFPTTKESADRSFIPLLSFSTVMVLLVTVSFTQQTKLKLLFNQTSNLDLADSAAAPVPIQLKDTNRETEELAKINATYTGTAPIFTYAQTANLDSVENTPAPNVLAAITDTSSDKQTFDPGLILLLLSLSLLFIPLTFKKASVRLEYHPAVTPPPATPEEKIIEINQKTDGTVVLCIRDREFKICKPELDSESDRFIDRLMSLASSGNKEIDYDAYNDSKTNLSAPLSKLVTRLGFVGTIRDLFFPRTSKNRVLFRKYLTNTDLISMKLNPDQLAGQLLSTN